jgi:hypothetical protein
MIIKNPYWLIIHYTLSIINYLAVISPLAKGRKQAQPARGVFPAVHSNWPIETFAF